MLLLGEILQANDDLSHVINSYKTIVEGHSVSGDTEAAQGIQTSVKQGTESRNQSEILIDLVGLDSPSPPEHKPVASSLPFPGDLLSGSTATNSPSKSVGAPSAALSLLDEELLSLGLNEPGSAVSESTQRNQSNHLPSSQDSSQDLGLFDTGLPTLQALSTPSLFQDVLSTSVASVSPNKTTTTIPASSFPGLVFPTPPVSDSASVIFPQPLSSALNTAASAAAPQSLSSSPALSAARQNFSFPGVFQSASFSLSHNLQDLAMLDLGSNDNLGGTSITSASVLAAGVQGWSPPPAVRSHADDSPLLRSLSPILPMSQASPSRGDEASLAGLFVPLEAIKPSKVLPVTAYDRNGVRVLLTFATDCPPGRPNVLVMVASMLNTAPQAVRSVVLQAAVPRTMKVKLQPPSGTELAPFNPLLPPPSITQIMLLANPLKEKVRMRYKLMFTLGEQPFTEVGEVNEFPPADQWGAL